MGRSIIADPDSRYLVKPTDWRPCPVKDGDEVFRNGIFLFNITLLMEKVERQYSQFPVVEIQVEEWSKSFQGELDPVYVEQADLNRPVLLAEIAPDRFERGFQVSQDDWRGRGYNLIDGHHRLRKANEMGISTLHAVIVRMEHHLEFLAEGYGAYVDYWNLKLSESMR